MYAAGNLEWRGRGLGSAPRSDARPGAGRRRALRSRLVLAAWGLGVAAGLGLAHTVHGSAGMPQRVVVEPGDTLWSIAADHYPNDDPRDRAEEIESYNHLQGVSVHPGEVLQLPAD